MINLYYEIKEGAGFAYYRRSYYNVTTSRMAYLASRIWYEEDGRVRYYKNRLEPTENEICDMEEFLWIKLKSKPA